MGAYFVQTRKLCGNHQCAALRMDTCVLPRPRCGRWVGIYATFTAFMTLMVVVRRLS